jgi:coenzyme Q-binding protein COQ10
MSTHSECRILPYTADLMYAVVSDVEKYPEFLPWVLATRILWRQSDSVFDCEMAVGFAGFSERYTSRVTLDPDAHAIDVMQVRGPFSCLENHWRFTPQGGGCKVDFAIAFEFRNPLLNLVAGKAFEHAVLKMSGAFEARARALSTAPNTQAD